MKKLIALLLALLLCLTLFGCGEKDEDDDKDTKEKSSQQDDKGADKDADKDPSAAPEKTKLDEFIASDEIQKEVSYKDDDREMTVTTENGDTVVLTMKLLEDLSAEELREFAEEFDRNANDEDLQDIADSVKEAGAGDSVKIRVQVLDKDGNKVTEYKTELSGDADVSEEPSTDAPTTEAPTTEPPTTEPPTTERTTTETPSLPDEGLTGLMDLESFVSFMNVMMQQAGGENEEFTMKFELEGRNNLVMTMQSKIDLPEDQLEEMRNTEFDDEEFNIDEIKGMLAMYTGVADVKITIRLLDKNGNLIIEKTAE